MRVKYTDDPRVQWGGTFDPAYAVYRNSPYQRGAGLGSVFRSLWRVALPIVKRIGRVVGKQALKTGVGVAGDLIEGEDLGESVKKRGKAGAKALLKRGEKAIAKSQRGAGLGRPRGKRTTIPINRKKNPPNKRARVGKIKVDAFGKYNDSFA